MTDEELLRSLLQTATRDLQAPRVQLRSRLTLAPVTTPPTATRRRWRRKLLLGATAVGVGAAAAVGTTLGLGIGNTAATRTPPRAGRSTAAAPAATTGSAVLYRLASTVRALPSPTGRYAVQVEQQTEGSSSYLKATVIDSRTGNTWTYQRGPGVPSVLPMAPGFSPTEAQLQSSDPTDPTKLRTALIAQASAANPHPLAPQTPNDLAVTQAIDTLWNPLVQPALRGALVSVIASSPGVSTDPRATDARGRKSIEISYRNPGLGVRLSVYLDPATGTVLESSEEPYTAGANPSLAGSDVYLSQYWTNTSPTVNPLDH